MESSPAATIAIACVGVVGALVGALLGYQTGEKTVNKDYVQIAMSNLNNEKSTPELREWSVTILNKLSPVPMNSDLRKELTQFVYAKPSPIPIAPFAKELCPDLIGQDTGRANTIAHHEAMDRKFIEQYEKCRIKFANIVKYINDINTMTRNPHETSVTGGAPLQTPSP